MQEIINRLLQVKNEDEFWFGFFANQILSEFDFDYKQECDLLREQINYLEQKNDELQEEVEELEGRIEELENEYDAE